MRMQSRPFLHFLAVLMVMLSSGVIANANDQDAIVVLTLESVQKTFKDRGRNTFSDSKK